MRVFITGASGHIGSGLVPELRGAGHQVVGLARSDRSATTLQDAGAEVWRGELSDLDGLRAAAADADGVIHLAFDHDAMFAGDVEAAIATDRRAIDALADALDGSGKPFIGTSGTMLLGGVAGGPAIEDRPGTELDALEGGHRIDAENAVIALAERGVRSSVVRLPPITHSELDHHGFAPILIGLAREHGAAGYLGDGSNRWPSVDTRDAARVYRLALERAKPGTRLHAVADEGVPFREIAEAIGRQLALAAVSVAPEDASQRFSFLAGFVGFDNPTSSELTRQWLGWEPREIGLLEDLARDHYFAATGAAA